MVTQDQLKTIEENRIKALERLRSRQTQPTSPPKETTNAIIKNAPQVSRHWTPSASTTHSGKRKLFDYDLSQMHDTRAGYLPEETSKEFKKPAPKIHKHKVVYDELPAATLNIVCEKCESRNLDADYYTHFKLAVCSECRKNYPDEYSLLTKTEVKEDYLFTDEELRDTDLLPFWERPNPRRSTYARMKLYVRKMCEEVAFKKWGGAEGLDQEFERRQNELAKRKEKEALKKMKELRQRTRTSLWKEERSVAIGASFSANNDAPRKASANGNHVHVFDQIDGDHRKCSICNLTIEVEEL